MVLHYYSVRENTLLDLVIVADKSESLSRADSQELFTFIKELIANLDVDSGAVRIAFVEYSNTAAVRFNLQQFSSSDNMILAIENMDPDVVRSAGTNTGM